MFDINELHNIAVRASDQSRNSELTPLWRRAFEDLAFAAVTLEALIFRKQIEEAAFEANLEYELDDYLADQKQKEMSSIRDASFAKWEAFVGGSE